jgi:hypothetical protein
LTIDYLEAEESLGGYHLLDVASSDRAPAPRRHAG